jgi:hypothetical protein
MAIVKNREPERERVLDWMYYKLLATLQLHHWKKNVTLVVSLKR